MIDACEIAACGAVQGKALALPPGRSVAQPTVRSDGAAVEERERFLKGSDTAATRQTVQSIPSGRTRSTEQRDLWQDATTITRSIRPSAKLPQPLPLSQVLDILNTAGPPDEGGGMTAAQRTTFLRSAPANTRISTTEASRRKRASPLALCAPADESEMRLQPSHTQEILTLFAWNRGQRRQEMDVADARRKVQVNEAHRFRHSKAAAKCKKNTYVASKVNRLVPMSMLGTPVEESVGAAQQAARTVPAVAVGGQRHTAVASFTSPQRQKRWLEQLHHAEHLNTSGEREERHDTQHHHPTKVCARNNHYNNYHLPAGETDQEGVTVCRRRYFAFVQPNKPDNENSTFCDTRYGVCANMGKQKTVSEGQKPDPFIHYVNRRQMVGGIINPAVVGCLVVTMVAGSSYHGAVSLKLKSTLWCRSKEATTKLKSVVALEEAVSSRKVSEYVTEEALRPTASEQLLALALPPAYLDPLPNDDSSSHNLCFNGLFNRKEAFLLDRIFERR